jgi:thymidylate synthase
MEPYDDALREILKDGTKKQNRTGVDTIGINGMQKHYDISEYYPLLTGRKISPKAGLAELLWFLSGSTNNKDLVALGAKFWTPWVDRGFEQVNGYEEDDFGPIYGFQLRHQGGNYREIRKLQKELKSDEEKLKDQEEWDRGFFTEENPLLDHHCVPKSSGMRHKLNQKKIQLKAVSGYDQLSYMQYEIKNSPFSRRILFSLWNMQDFSKMRLPPCHYTYQVLVDGKNRLTGILTQRSNDLPCGVPFNIQFYSTLTLMFAHMGGFEPYEFVHNMNDAHIYVDQIDAVEEYLSLPKYDSPKIKINFKDILDQQGNLQYTMDDFEIIDYKHGPFIKIPVAV